MRLLLAAAALLAAQPQGAVVELERTVVELEATVVDLTREVVAFEGDRDVLVVAEVPDQVELRLAADVFFAPGQDVLTPDAVRILDGVVPRLREEATAPVTIEGHTDEVDDEAYNQALSERRAEAVRAHLARPEALGGLTFEVRGLGETRPIAPNTNPDGSDNAQGRAQNRRVELRYAPREGR